MVARVIREIARNVKTNFRFARAHVLLVLATSDARFQDFLDTDNKAEKRCELLMHDTDRSPHPASSTGHGRRLTLHLRSAIICSPSDRYVNETLCTYLSFLFAWL